MWALRPPHEPARGPASASTSPSSCATRRSRSTGSSAASSACRSTRARRGPTAARVLQHAGRRAVHRQLDALVLLARHRRASSTAARAAAREPERLPRRPLGRHRLHRALRRDRLQPDGRRPGRSGLREAPRPRAARGRRRLDARRAASRGDSSTASRPSSTAALFGAVRDNAPRCVDGTTPCTIANEAVDCAGHGRRQVHAPTAAYASRRRPPEPAHPRRRPSRAPSRRSIDPDGGQIILQVDQGGAGQQRDRARSRSSRRSACSRTPTAPGRLGSFIDDDGVVAALASFVATSVGGRGPVASGLATWLDLEESDQWPACPAPPA